MMFKKNKIRAWCAKAGFKQARELSSLNISGMYTHNIQVVYNRQNETADGLIDERLFFAADMDRERVFIGYLKKNMDVKDGVILNRNTSLLFEEYNEEKIYAILDKLIG